VHECFGLARLSSCSVLSSNACMAAPNLQTLPLHTIKALPWQPHPRASCFSHCVLPAGPLAHSFHVVHLVRHVFHGVHAPAPAYASACAACRSPRPAVSCSAASISVQALVQQLQGLRRTRRPWTTCPPGQTCWRPPQRRCTLSARLLHGPTGARAFRQPPGCRATLLVCVHFVSQAVARPHR